MRCFGKQVDVSHALSVNIPRFERTARHLENAAGAIPGAKSPSRHQSNPKSHLWRQPPATKAFDRPRGRILAEGPYSNAHVEAMTVPPQPNVALRNRLALG